jgi:hypothetical protein
MKFQTERRLEMKAKRLSSLCGLLILTLFLPGLLLAQGPQPVITITSDIHGGSGSYEDPFVLHTNVINWRLDETYGSNLKSGSYTTEIKMSRHRSCAPVIRFPDMSWSEAKSKTFSWTGVTGVYHIDYDVEYNGEETHVKQFFYLKVPPVKSFSVPYTAPGNHAPNPYGKILNYSGGSGSVSDPLMLQGPFIRFTLDACSDPDGANDFKYGVHYWAIYTEGHHPAYSSTEQGEREPSKTYMQWGLIDGTVFEWDTRLRPSEDNLYTLVAVMYDQHGEYAEERIRFYYDPNSGETKPSYAKLNVSPRELFLGAEETTQSFKISNTGTIDLSWEISITQGNEWIKSLSADNGSLNPGGTKDISLAIERSAVNEGNHQGELKITSNGGEETVLVFFFEDHPPLPPVHVEVFIP